MKKKIRIISLILCLALLFTEFQGFSLRALAAGEDSSDNAEESEYTDDDDPLRFRANGIGLEGFYDEEEEASIITEDINDSAPVKGIDVSAWQGDIDWGKVKGDGIAFVIIRAGYRGSSEGALNTDKKFHDYIKGATAAGIPVGVYFYSEAVNTSEAKDEANYCLNLIKGYNVSLPVAIDFEPGTNGGRQSKAGLSKDAATSICMTFCDTVKSAGYNAMVYANKSDLTNRLNAGTIAAKYDIWLAQYNSQVTYGGAYTFWQYSSKGSVSGISGNVDMDYWYTDSHFINYVLNGGTNHPDNPSRYRKDTGVISLKNPTKDGYTFKGWYTEADFKNKISSIDTSVTQGITVYAKWEQNGYYVKYDANAEPLDRKASGSMKKSVLIPKSKDNKLLACGFKVEGYTFVGWNTRSDGKGYGYGTKKNQGDCTVGTDFEDKKLVKKLGDTVILYAQWEPVIKEARFFKNLNNEPPVEFSVIVGDKISDILYLESDYWTVPGYTLKCWTTNPNGLGKKYTRVNSELYKKDATVCDFYAVWEPETYTVKYDADGGKNNKKNPKKYKFNSSEITLLEPTKKGYTFVKWVDAESEDYENAEAITKLGSNVTSNLVLKAVWRENEYTVNYHFTDPAYLGVSENTISITYRYTEEMRPAEALKKLALKEEYFYQKGIQSFGTKPNGKGKKYSVKKAYSKLFKNDGEVLDLYTCFGKAAYAIDYNLCGGVNNIKNPYAYDYNKKKSVKIKAPKKEGYIFTGWKCVSGNQTDFDEVKSCINKGASGRITLSANYVPVKYTVKLNLNIKDSTVYFMDNCIYNGIEYEAAVSQNCIPSINIPEYYRLVSWNTKKNGKGMTVSPNSIGEIELSHLCTKNGGKVTLYAIWEPVEYPIDYFNLDPDDTVEYLTGVLNKNPDSYSYSSKKSYTLKNPVKYGFKFKGWYLDRAMTKKITSIKKKTSGKLVIYGKWAPIKN